MKTTLIFQGKIIRVSPDSNLPLTHVPLKLFKNRETTTRNNPTTYHELTCALLRVCDLQDHRFLSLIGSLHIRVEHARGLIHVLHFRCRSKHFRKWIARNLCLRIYRALMARWPEFSDFQQERNR